jgi:hypothetical protein
MLWRDEIRSQEEADDQLFKCQGKRFLHQMSVAMIKITGNSDLLGCGPIWTIRSAWLGFTSIDRCDRKVHRSVKAYHDLIKWIMVWSWGIVESEPCPETRGLECTTKRWKFERCFVFCGPSELLIEIKRKSSPTINLLFIPLIISPFRGACNDRNSRIAPFHSR